ncbi:hypothetical protein [Deinococcus ruber]|uniref:Lipoprotein n=1 Tax=Deinococcus ruber TaxID=1848197 RepID=A0A918BXS2_9DEIO|nr:hypothetical protein [Deinococcus ruber]GGQ95796.1 hypothetical protein GCM10008957_05400 [Deinococcus ruber]
MPRFLTVFLGLSVLLSACTKPVVVPANDPNILSGQWTGQVVQRRNITAAFSTDSRVYLQDGTLIEGYDIGTGKRLGVIHLPNSAVQLSYRDDGVFVALDRSVNKLYTFDAATFQQLSATSTPNQGNWMLSRDGNVLIAGGATGPLQYSTRNGQLIPLSRGQFGAG